MQMSSPHSRPMNQNLWGLSPGSYILKKHFRWFWSKARCEIAAVKPQGVGGGGGWGEKTLFASGLGSTMCKNHSEEESFLSSHMRKQILYLTVWLLTCPSTWRVEHTTASRLVCPILGTALSFLFSWAHIHPYTKSCPSNFSEYFQTFSFSFLHSDCLSSSPHWLFYFESLFQLSE